MEYQYLKKKYPIINIKRWWKSRELSHFNGNIRPFYKVIYNSCYQVIGFETYY
ncbi:MAG TPA: hypothetical protein PLE45_11140 [Spirochaetota bacterium]|nr:hypothetical protein [Spirochaetota bacterium]HPP05284.1 hypothetical protein [Spirochaetota bacterium]